MPSSLLDPRVRSAALMVLLASVALYAQAPAGQGQGAPPAPAVPMMQASPLLNAIDVNHDGTISAEELANAPARLRTLDKNGDGKLTRDEAAMPARGRGPGGPGAPGGRGEGAPRGEGAGRAGQAAPGERENFEVPIPGPTAEELLATLLMFDKNKDGKLDKTEVPERQQGIFERGDTDKNGILDAAELKKMTADQAAAPPAPPAPRGPGRGGFGGGDVASMALDTDKNGEISAEEIANAVASLKTLDKNNDGMITEDEVRPNFGPGRGPGGPGGGPGSDAAR